MQRIAPNTLPPRRNNNGGYSGQSESPAYSMAMRIRAEQGYTAKLTDVLAVYVPDRPGGLATILGKLAEKNVALEYLYSFVRNAGDHALIIMRVDKLEDAVSVLKAAGVRMLAQEDIQAL